MRAMKTVITLLVFAILFSGCTGYDKNTELDGVTYYINSLGKTAFASEYEWSVSEETEEVIIPEQVEGASVEKLGGFFGIGVPSPFGVTANGAAFETADPYGSYDSPLILKNVPVTIHLPKTLNEIDTVFEHAWFGNKTETGEILFLRPVVHFETDPANPVFEARDGLLYRKSDNSLIDLSELTDDTIPKAPLRKRLTGRYMINISEEETEVLEFFSAFGVVYAHINWYMNGSEYTFSALELTPFNRADLESIDADSFDASARQFSDFSMAGQYTDAEFPGYRITVREDSIILVGLDEHDQPVMDSGIEIEKDNTQPSQFPFDLNDPSLPDSSDASFSSVIGNLANTQANERYACDDYHLRIGNDGTLTLARHNTETPEIYRGIAAFRSDQTDHDLCFALTKTGGTREPRTGRVRIERSDDGIIVHPVEGYESAPLIPEGSESITLNLES